ncbi:MAG: hypothetical protein PHU27_05215 [Salinivirgaceae bacterium]|nr:hypothetical protein [Salinivirgaceae bacterium]MDD4747377.1 hypothetical protein [Salinivirgaceae bacterium]
MNWMDLLINELRKNKTDFINLISRFHHFDIETLQKYTEILNWDLVSKNENVFWDKNLIKEYSHKFNWNFISVNKAIPWDIELLTQYDARIIWKGFFSLSNNEGLFWNNLILEKFIDKWDWADEYGICSNSKIFWSDELINRYYNRINWRSLSLNESGFWVESLIEEYYPLIDLINICSNPGVRWTNSLIESIDMDNKWIFLGSNNGLPWTEELFYENKKEISLNSFCLNTSFPWSFHFIEKEFTSYDPNAKINTKIDIRDRLSRSTFIDEFDNYSISIEIWENLSANSSIQWDYYNISKFDNFLWFKNHNPSTQKERTGTIFNNEGVKWNEFLINKLSKKIDWVALSANRSIDWDYSLIENYYKLWDFNMLSNNISFYNFLRAKFSVDSLIKDVMQSKI